MKLLFNEYVGTTPDPLHADAGIISRGVLAHGKRQMLSDPLLILPQAFGECLQPSCPGCIVVRGIHNACVVSFQSQFPAEIIVPTERGAVSTLTNKYLKQP